MLVGHVDPKEIVYKINEDTRVDDVLGKLKMVLPEIVTVLSGLELLSIRSCISDSPSLS